MRLVLLLMLPLLATVMNPQSSRSRIVPDPDPGVSETLAHERTQAVSNVRYDLSLTIPANRQTPVAGAITASFTLAQPDAPLVFDFAPDRAGLLRKVMRGTETLSVRQVNGHVIVPKEALQTGENRVTFVFDAGNASLNRSDDFLYTIFVPARAHQAFPCFDQPDLKARWSLRLEVPEGWQALGNGAELERDTRDGRTRLRLVATPPISTYLFA